jgi:hypothetical protein
MAFIYAAQLVQIAQKIGDGEVSGEKQLTDQKMLDAIAKSHGLRRHKIDSVIDDEFNHNHEFHCLIYNWSNSSVYVRSEDWFPCDPDYEDVWMRFDEKSGEYRQIEFFREWRWKVSDDSLPSI